MRKFYQKGNFVQGKFTLDLEVIRFCLGGALRSPSVSFHRALTTFVIPQVRMQRGWERSVHGKISNTRRLQFLTVTAGYFSLNQTDCVTFCSQR